MYNVEYMNPFRGSCPYYRNDARAFGGRSRSALTGEVRRSGKGKRFQYFSCDVGRDLDATTAALLTSSGLRFMLGVLASSVELPNNTYRYAIGLWRECSLRQGFWKVWAERPTWAQAVLISWCGSTYHLPCRTSTVASTTLTWALTSLRRPWGPGKRKVQAGLRLDT